MSRQLHYAALQAEKLNRQAEAAEIAHEVFIRRQGRSARSGELECCICSEKLADCTILPCEHNTFCYACLQEYKRKNERWRCPLCRGVIRRVVQ